jgi:hypothetical protein
MRSKPANEQPTAGPGSGAEPRAPAPEDLPARETLHRLERVAERLEALCEHARAARADPSPVSALFARLERLEDRLERLSRDGDEGASATRALGPDRNTPDQNPPRGPATIDPGVVEFLAAGSPFAKYGAEDCEALARFMDRTVLADESVLFSQGQTGDALYVVMSGLLEIFRKDASGEVHVADVVPGELVGEMALIDDLPRSASVRARQKAELLVLSRAAYRDLEKTHPPFAVKLHKELLAVLSARLRRTTDKVVGG